MPSATPGDIRAAYLGKRAAQLFAVLRAMLNAAVKRRLIAYSPCLGVELESPEDHEASVWGPEQVERFLAYAEEHEPRYAVAYRLALKFGMRRGEILALELADVGDDIHVRRNAVAVGSQVVVGKPKSRVGDRTIPVDADPDMPAALRRPASGTRPTSSPQAPAGRTPACSSPASAAGWSSRGG